VAKPKTATHWVDRARDIFQNAVGPKPSGEKIAEKLRMTYKADATGPPSGRKVRDIIREHRKLLPSKQREHEYFTWPRSMRLGLLPWEASRDLLDLVRYRHDQPSKGVIALPIARAYWRACQAMPGAEIDEKYKVATQLAWWEVAGEKPPKEAKGAADSTESLHWYVAYAPWRSDEDKEIYNDQIELYGAFEEFKPTITTRNEDASYVAQLAQGPSTEGELRRAAQLHALRKDEE